MSKKHKVKVHHWEDGVLKTVEHLTDALADAMALIAQLQSHQHAKIYNEENEIVHTVVAPAALSVSTYA